MKAVFDDQLDVVKTLLEDETVDVNEEIYDNCNINSSEDRCGWSCLHAAAYLNRVECVQLLVDNSRVNIIEAHPSRLQTALHVACGKGHKKIVEIITNALRLRKAGSI